MSSRPKYFRVFLTFLRNSLVRDMMFPTNFIIEAISSLGWVAMNLALYILIFNYTNYLGTNAAGEGAWGAPPFRRVNRSRC